MKFVLLLLTLCAPVQAQVLKQNGSNPRNTSVTFSSITVTNLGTFDRITVSSNIAITGTLNVTGVATVGSTVTIASGAGLIGKVAGTLTNDSAPPGYVGEFISGVPGGAITFPTSASVVSIATITLSAGDWDVTGTFVMCPDGTATITKWGCYVSTTNDGIDGSASASGGSFELGSAPAVNICNYAPLGVRRISIASSTPVYMSCRVTYGAGSGTWETESRLRARRVR